MGLLVDGKWNTDLYDTKSNGGRFVRQVAKFRDRVTANGSSGFRAEPGRYHLYVSLACPWASRALVFRKLKKLEDVITLSIVDPRMGHEGWVFSDYPGSIPDGVNGFNHLHEVYTAANPEFTGRVTVPAGRTFYDVAHELAEPVRLRRERDARSGIRQQWRVPLRCANAESVRFLSRVEYFRIASQCGTHFLLSCRPTTTKGGRKQGARLQCISPHGWCSCFCYSGKLRFWRWEVSYFGWRGNSAMILRDGRACAAFASGAGRNSRKQ